MPVVPEEPDPKRDEEDTEQGERRAHEAAGARECHTETDAQQVEWDTGLLRAGCQIRPRSEVLE